MVPRTGQALVILLVAFLYLPVEPAAADPTRVLVAYNSNAADSDQDGTNDSLQIANYYVAKRGVPAANVVALPISLGYYDSANYAKFQSEIVQPLKSKLSQLGPANIDIILLCGGIPTQVYNSGRSAFVSIDNTLIALNFWNSSTNNISWSTNPYLATRPTFETDKPHFTHASYKYASTEMYLVTRLDRMNLVDQALYGERYIAPQGGYYNGTIYVDSRYANYTDEQLTADPEVINGFFTSYNQVDKNIAYTEHYALGSGFPHRWEKSGSVIGTFGTTYHDGTSAETAPRTLFYAGWYGGSPTPFEWLAGSIGCHLHSMSFAGSGSWADAALGLGAAGVAGTIGEPYTTGHQRPNVLVYYILKGYNFAEASMLATPSVGWMPMNIGDPLYAPLKAKSPVVDTRYPAVAPGYPTVAGAAASGNRTVNIRLQDVPEPEVARIELEYGFDTAYGLTKALGPAYYGIAGINLSGLQGGRTYHYRLKLTDPAGNVTTTGDYAFTTGAIGNTAPTALDQAVITGHDVVTPITLAGTDAEQNALYFNKVTGPAHGTVVINGTSASYTPSAGYSGLDSFTFRANDGALDSNIATVSITVMPTTEVTVVLQHGLNGYAGAKDATISGYGSEADWNWGGAGDLRLYSEGSRAAALAFDLSAIPTNALVSSAKLELFSTGGGTDAPTNVRRFTRSWVEGTGVYQNTVDGVTYRTYDGVTSWTTPGGDFDPAVVAQMVAENGANRWLSWSVRDVVQGWVAAPGTNFGMLLRNGTWRESSYLSKESARSELRPKLTVSYYPQSQGPNHAPVAQNQSVTTTENTPTTVTLNATDVDGNALSYSIVAAPSRGFLSAVSGATVTYTPSANFSGSDSFTFKANDGLADSNVATISITVFEGGGSRPNPPHLRLAN